MEEWLATDVTLDRPILVRSLGPEAGPERRAQFLEAVRAAATVTHVHLASVYAVGEHDGSAYAVLEWTGGITIGDRLRAGLKMPDEEFLPNAAGLAEAVAALHRAGPVHGAIDADAIQFSTAHPAKLGAFGRRRRYESPHGDTSELATVLTRAITLEGSLPPSEVTGVLSPAVDQALDVARSGRLDAAGFAASLRTTPHVPRRRPAGAWSWNWVTLAGLLLFLAAGIIGLGLLIGEGSDLPFLYPAAARSTSTAAPLPAQATAYDPLGDNREMDQQLSLAIDGDPQTAWSTEQYRRPLQQYKAGVGIAFDVEGDPGRLELLATEGTALVVGWAQMMPGDVTGWEQVASTVTAAGAVEMRLPERADGVWLLWLTELPRHQDGERHYALIYEVRFLP
ncbi:MAG: protein kinase [Acidimicrobiia bacterium]